MEKSRNFEIVYSARTKLCKHFTADRARHFERMLSSPPLPISARSSPPLPNSGQTSPSLAAYARAGTGDPHLTGYVTPEVAEPGGHWGHVPPPHFSPQSMKCPTSTGVHARPLTPVPPPPPPPTAEHVPPRLRDSHFLGLIVGGKAPLP